LKPDRPRLTADPDEATRRRGRPSVFDARRLQVLSVASQIFSVMGFRQATLKDVAESLGFTRTALYHYAKSKGALLVQCTEIAVGLLDDAIARSLQETTGAGQLRMFFRLYREIGCEGFGRCFALTDLSEMDKPARVIIRRQRVRLARSIGGMIRLGIADGTIRDCDARLVSNVLFVTFNHVAPCVANRTGQKRADVADTILNFFFNGLAPEHAGHLEPKNARIKCNDANARALNLAPHAID
jgi:TetR/AcrR family transcriptional regulator